MPTPSELSSNPPAAPGSKSAAHAGDPAALKGVLSQSKGAQEKVVAVGDVLETTNDQVRSLISTGTDSLPADESLAQNEQVESSVKEVAVELDQVNEALAQGVEDLEVVGKALIESHVAEQEAEAKLIASEQERDIARDRALHDLVTGLPNRALFDDRLAHAISMADRHAWTLAVMFLDLDRFKEVNDTFGHAAGDQALKEVARRLAFHSRDEDTVCRYGGDEFLMLLVDPQGSENVERIADAVTASIAEPIDVGTAQVSLGSSIGIAYYPSDGSSAPELLEYADAAMYAVKRRGRR